ncbi:MAG: GNAT family N-acetyltransferase [Pseudomonadota bacterium]
MLDVAPIEITVESPNTPDGSGMIARAERGLAQDAGGVTAEELHGPNVEFLVARRNGRPVGCVALVDQLRYGEVSRLYVDESDRGTGIGAALMDALEQAASEIGLRSIRISAAETMGDVVTFCQQFGFTDQPAAATAPGVKTPTFLEKTI